MSPDDLSDVLAAAALGDGEAVRKVAELAGRNPNVSDHLSALRRTVAALDQSLATAPPRELRSRLLGAARRQRGVGDLSAVPGLFDAQVEAMGNLLASLDIDDWTRPARPYEWTVHGLVAHLLVIEEYTAALFGLHDGATTDEHDDRHHLEMGADRIATELAGSPQETAARWLARARRTADALQQPDTDLPASVTLHGWPFSTDGAVIARAFEIWTHADDIRRAAARDLVAPSPGDLRTMSNFSVRALPLTLPLVAPDQRLDAARIVLTGDGGGTYDIGDGSEPTATLVADVVDYCRFVARRIRPGELDCTIDGDETLVHALLAGATVFAV